MSLRVLGKPIATAEMSTAQVYERVKIPALTNMLIRGVNIGLVVYNNPAFTSLHLDLYDDDSGVPGKKIAQSNSFSKAQIHSLPHAYKVVGFTFMDVAVRGGTYVHFALGAVGYVGDDTSHLAWRNSYPDPQFITGVALDAAHADNHPLEIALVGAEI
jgi:hypothetical protein